MAILDAFTYAFDQRLFNLYNPSGRPDSDFAGDSYALANDYLGFAYTPDSYLGGAAEMRYWSFLGDTPGHITGYGTVLEILGIWADPANLDPSLLTNTSANAIDALMLWRLTGGGRNIIEFNSAAASASNVDDIAFLTMALANADTFNLSGQNDYALGFGGNDTMNGGAGNDSLQGGLGADVLSGGAGEDLLIYQPNDSTLFSMDTITDFSAGDSIELSGSAGLRAAMFTYVTSVPETVDAIVATGVNDHLYLFNDGAAWYVYVNGAGTGTSHNGTLIQVYVDDVTNLYVVGTSLITQAANYTLGSGQRDITYVGSSAFTAIGNSDANVLTGAAGNDNLSGLGGNDTLYGQDGGDQLRGGTGNDYISGGNGNDSIVAEIGNDFVLGGAGLDVITYVSGEHYIDGGEGQDILNFEGISARTIYVNLTLQRLVVSTQVVGATPNTLSDEISTLIRVPTVYGAFGATHRMIGDDNPNVFVAGSRGDWIFGGVGNDTIIGGAGHDTLSGGSGVDLLYESVGDDFFIVDHVEDRVELVPVFYGGTSGGVDTVETSVTYSIEEQTFIENLSLVGDEDIAAIGNSAANTIIGNAGANDIKGRGGHDIVNGGDGDDTLTGGRGADLLRGGTGRDVFRYTSAEDSKVGSNDAILDYNPIEDSIQFVGLEGMGLIALIDQPYATVDVSVAVQRIAQDERYANARVFFIAKGQNGNAAGYLYVNGAGTGTNFDTTLIKLSLGGSGVASDGYLSGALVWIDANNNGARDWSDTNNNGRWDEGEGESWAITDGQGRYSGLEGSGTLRVTANPNGSTVDISTGLAFTGSYAAPSGSSVINPLTTVLAASGDSSAIRQAFGLDSSVDLTTYDPLAAATASDGDASQAAVSAIHTQGVNAQLANILAVSASMMTAAGADPSTNSDASRAIVEQLMTRAQSGPIDLSSASVISEAIAAGATGILNDTQRATFDTQLGVVSTAMGAINSRIQSVSNRAATDVENQLPIDADALLRAVISAQIVAQQNLVDQARDAVLSNNGGAVTINPANVGQLISEAAASVGQVLTPGASHRYAASINDIEAAGLSADGNTLVLKFNTNEVVFLPIESTGLSLAGVGYSTQEIMDQFTLRPAFTYFLNNTTAYLLPDLFTGDPSLGLLYQWIDSRPDAVVLGSNFADFIVLQGTGNKAVNGEGGADVIDGGTGSTFVTGGGVGDADTFFLDGRAPGVSWSTITDFELGLDKATIWGWREGISRASVLFDDVDTGGAAGYTGLTLHFENLLPDDAPEGSTNANFNSITLSGLRLSDFGASSVEELNMQIANDLNNHFIVGQTVDDFGTHGYLFIS